MMHMLTFQLKDNSVLQYNADRINLHLRGIETVEECTAREIIKIGF